VIDLFGIGLFDKCSKNLAGSLRGRVLSCVPPKQEPKCTNVVCEIFTAGLTVIAIFAVTQSSLRTEAGPQGPTGTGKWITLSSGAKAERRDRIIACLLVTRCNRLRWHRTEDALRDLLLYGVIAVKEIKARSQVGKELERLKKARLDANARRRRRQK
jgi:hypothetical protein